MTSPSYWACQGPIQRQPLRAVFVFLLEEDSGCRCPLSSARAPLGAQGRARPGGSLCRPPCSSSSAKWHSRASSASGWRSWPPASSRPSAKTMLKAKPANVAAIDHDISAWDPRRPWPRARSSQGQLPWFSALVLWSLSKLLCHASVIVVDLHVVPHSRFQW